MGAAVSEVLSDEDVFGPGGPGAAAQASKSAKSGVLSDEDVFGLGPQKEPGWGEVGLEALKRGVHGNAEAARQTGQALRGEAPTPEAERPPDKFSKILDEPYDFTSLPDANTPKKVFGKTVQGLTEAAPEMGGAIAGGAAASPAGPVAAMAGAGAGAAVVNAAKTIAPAYAQELQATPEDPDGALTRAIKKTAISAGATGAAFAAFENPLLKDSLKGVLANIFGVQPAIAAAQKAATNVVDNKPVLEGVPQAAGEGAAGVAAPIAAHAGIKALMPRAKAAPEAPAAPEKPAPQLSDWITGVRDEPAPGEPLALPPPNIAMPDESHQPAWRNEGTIHAGPPQEPPALPPPPWAVDATRAAQYARAASEQGVDAMGPSTGDRTGFVVTDKGGPPETQTPAAPAEPTAALPPPRRALPRPETTYGDGFTMGARAEAPIPIGFPEEPLALPKPATKYGEGWAATDEGNPRGTPFQRALYGMKILEPGDPVTNSVLKNISGLTDLEQIKYLRKTLVNRGLIVQKGVRYVRAGDEARSSRAAPAPAEAPAAAPAETAPPEPVQRAQPAAAPSTPKPPEAPPAPPPSISEAVQGEGIGGRHVKDDVAVTPTGREVPVAYQLVEADKLVPSQRDDLAANPAYPAELQPRDRTRAASAQQIHDIATTLNPRLLDASPKASDGAPIVAPDGVVESGNGRTLALRRAYDQNLPSAEAYRQYLKAQGYPVDGMKKPVLVRVRTGQMAPEDRLAFVREANARETLGMSATEQALSDGRALTPNLLDLYRGGDAGSAGNRQFVQAFMRDIVGKTEAAQLMTPTGELSTRGKQRIEAALAGKAYEDANLIQAMIEDPDPGIKAIGGAMMDVAGQWAKMRGEAAARAINPAMDVSQNLIQAAQLVRMARDQGRNVAEFVGQRDIFRGNAVDPRTESFLRIMFRDAKYSKPVGRDKIAIALNDFIEQARQSKPEAGLFGAADVVGPDQILERINARRQAGAPDQTDLLGGRPEPSGPGENAALRSSAGREHPGGAAGEEARGSGERQAQGVDEAAREVDTQPTDAQKEAGNYRKGHVKVHGLDITIENPKGSTRSGVGPDGKPWSVELPEHYGYIKRTTGQDGDHVDTYLGPNPQSERVWVVDQVHERTRAPDEHKVMLGFDTREQALQAYDRAFSDGKGPQRRGAVTELHVDELKHWLRVGDTKSPISDQIQDALRTRLDKMGLRDVGIRLVDQLKVKGETADGRYWKGVMDLARDNPKGLRGILSVMGHESVHAMRDLGLFKAGEWKAVEAWADRVGRKRYDIDKHYAKWGDAMRREEAFAHFVQDVLDGKVQRPAGLLARAVQKIRDFFEALINAVHHPFTEGSFTSAHSVVGKILSGEVGRRERAARAPDDFFARSARRVAAIKAAAEEIHTRIGRGERVMAQDRNGDTLVVTPATVGGFQVTKFEGRKPVGHIVFKDAADAAKHVARETTRGEEAAKIRAYHGSPHEFDRFSNEKIGTGEGAQAYGHGLYFAGRKAVAEHYRDGLSRGEPLAEANLSRFNQRYEAKNADAARLDKVAQILEQNAGRALREHGAKSAEDVKFWARTKIESQVESLRRQAAETRGAMAGELRKQADRYAEALKAIDSGEVDFSYSHGKGRLYTVDLAPEEHELLDWDRPLGEQSDFVKGALWSKASQFRLDPHHFEGGPNGSTFYQDLARHFRDSRDEYGMMRPYGDGPRLASDKLREAGIRGIRYSDGASRHTRASAEADVRSWTDAVKRFEDDLADTQQTLKIPDLRSDLKTMAQERAERLEGSLDRARNQLKEAQQRLADISHNYVIFHDDDVHIAEMASIRRQAQANEQREQTYPTQVRDSLNRWNGANDLRSTRQRVADSVRGIGRGSFERFYQEAVDRRAAFARNERARAKRGDFAASDVTKDGDLHARVSAHKAAMMYDRESSFAEQALVQGPIKYDGLGFKAAPLDARGQKIGGLLDVLAPVGKAGVWREFAAFERITRAERLAAEGRDKQFTPADLQARRFLEQKYPWFRQVHDEVQRFNRSMLRLLVDTGRLSPEKATEWARAADYTPFYRELLQGSGGVKGPLHVDGLTNDNSFRRLKGGDAQVGEYLENMTRNLRASIAAGLKNVAATRALRDAEALGLAQRVKGNPVQLEHAPDVVRVYENGKAAYFKVTDQLTFDALEGMNGSPLNPLLKALGYPANLLRKLTTHSPTFLLVNHPMRESMQAFLTSRENVAPVLSAVKGQLEVLRNSPLTQDLKAHGVGGGFDLTTGDRARQHILRQYKGQDGVLGALWHGYERLIDSADLGTRTQIYKKELSRLGGRPGDEYEAAIASLRQGVNFKQRGASEALRWATIAIPFLNARIQGLDTLGRAFADRPMQTWSKALMMVGMASAYYAWVRNNPTYQRASEQQKDENFLLPIPGTDKLFHLPAPFEAGILFKRIPERILRLVDGSDLPRDTKQAFFHAVLDSLHFNPIPQAALPALEVAANHDFYTGREVVPPRLAELPVPQRQNDRTSEVAKGIGAATGTAPMNVDHLLRGYFGTVGGYALFATDALTQAVKGGPSKPATTTTQLPALGTVLKDARNIGSEQQNRFYELKHEVDEVVKGVTALKKTDPARAAQLQRDNVPLLGAKVFTDNVGKALSKVRAQEVQVRASATMSPDQKRAQLDALDAQRSKLLERVETVRRKAYGS